MPKPAAKKPSPSRNEPVVKKVPLTLQGQVEKWFLPVVFVAIASVFVWAIVKEVMAPVAK
jgi:hypothetical protein